jgi:hypothetical protein
MVEISIRDHTLVVEVLGAHKLWALKGRIEVPLSSVQQIEARPHTKLGWWHGARIPGTHLPGVIVAGSYLKQGQWHFWDVVNARNTIEITLSGERYGKLFVEVADPEATVQLVRAALS